MFHGKIHSQWSFSIAMLNSQRVRIIQFQVSGTFQTNRQVGSISNRRRSNGVGMGPWWGRCFLSRSQETGWENSMICLDEDFVYYLLTYLVYYYLILFVIIMDHDWHTHLAMGFGAIPSWFIDWSADWRIDWLTDWYLLSCIDLRKYWLMDWVDMIVILIYGLLL